jgi:K+-transporting ATPase ATPase B chain
VEIWFVISLVLSFAPGLLETRRERARLQQYCVGHSVRYGAVCKLCRISGGGRGKAQAASLKKTKKDTQAAPA